MPPHHAGITPRHLDNPAAPGYYSSYSCSAVYYYYYCYYYYDCYSSTFGTAHSDCRCTESACSHTLSSICTPRTPSTSSISLKTLGSLSIVSQPLDDIRVRKAIAHAIDQRVWTAAFGDFVSPIYGIAPQGYYGAMTKDDVPKDDWPFVYDPAKSKALLAEAGFPNGFQIELFVTEREEYKSNVLIIQELLRKVGIQINMRVVEHTSYHNDIRRDLNSMIMYSSGQPPLTQAVLNAFYKSSAIVGKPTRNMNFSHYGDIAGNSDALMEQANQEVDDLKRIAMLKQVQIEILRHVPAIPLPSPAGSWMHNGKTLEIGFPVKAYMGTFTMAKASRL